MKILLCYQAEERHVAQIAGVAPGADISSIDQAGLAESLIDVDIFCGHAKVPVDWREVVSRRRLKWIQSSAAGLDHCLVPPIIDSDALVTSASGVFRNQVAEQTMALVYGLVRKLPVFFQAAQRQKFVRRPTDDLHGKTIGIVGFGGNGQRIADLLLPTGCRIVATDRFPQEWREFGQLPDIDALWPAEKLADLLRESHVVILTLPLGPQTTQIIGSDELNLMPSGAYLINVGRGGLVDEPALVEALQLQHLAGAGLDVTAVEPLPPGSPLWSLPNVLITPHVGAQSATRINDVTDLFCENLKRYFDGRTLRNLVDKNIGFPLPRFRV